MGKRVVSVTGGVTGLAALRAGMWSQRRAIATPTASDAINLAQGECLDAVGRVQIPQAVAAVVAGIQPESDIIGPSRGRLPITGCPDFLAAWHDRFFSVSQDLGVHTRVMQTPSASAGLELVARYLDVHRRDATVWVPGPGWSAYSAIFGVQGIRTYPYRSQQGVVDVSAILRSLEGLTKDDLFILPGVGHIPTGIDLGPAQAAIIAKTVANRNAALVIDAANTGYSCGVDQDSEIVDAALGAGGLAFTVHSCTKLFQLYRVPFGTLAVSSASCKEVTEVVKIVESLLGRICTGASMLGPKIATEVLTTPVYEQSWSITRQSNCLKQNNLRALLTDALCFELGNEMFDFLLHQQGIHAFLGLPPDLLMAAGICLKPHGGINITAVNSDNVEEIASRVARVVGKMPTTTLGC